MRAAVVNADNIVVNIIIVDSLDDLPPVECFLVGIDDIQCNVGWVYDQGSFVNPAPPVEGE
jgi:hypothetical protein